MGTQCSTPPELPLPRRDTGDRAKYNGTPRTKSSPRSAKLYTHLDATVYSLKQAHRTVAEVSHMTVTLLAALLLSLETFHVAAPSIAIQA
jgi:hypothetical protein